MAGNPAPELFMEPAIDRSVFGVGTALEDYQITVDPGLLNDTLEKQYIPYARVHRVEVGYDFGRPYALESGYGIPVGAGRPAHQMDEFMFEKRRRITDAVYANILEENINSHLLLGILAIRNNEFAKHGDILKQRREKRINQVVATAEAIAATGVLTSFASTPVQIGATIYSGLTVLAFTEGRIYESKRRTQHIPVIPRLKVAKALKLLRTAPRILRVEPRN